MRVIDLFSGIGGFSLGLERAGMQTVAFVEIDPYCQAVLRKHWPGVPIHGDIRTVDFVSGSADVVCGGFPCQDISLAGNGAGLSGERSGLWREFRRAIKQVRPAFAIIENVSALRSRGLDEVLRSLSEIGYDAEWHCIPASAVGAPHQRDRIWIIAYPGDSGHREPLQPLRQRGGKVTPDAGSDGEARALADPDSPHGPSGQGTPHGLGWGWSAANDLASTESGTDWPAEPDVGRVAHGVPRRVDRIRALGNAVVPQIPEIIGKAIIESMRGNVA